MKQFSFVLIAVVFIMATAFTTHTTNTNKKVHPTTTDAKVKAYYFKQCTYCHSQSERLAPRMANIKKIYLLNFPKEHDFVNKITDFVLKPEKNKRLYRSENYSTMPPEMFHDPEKIKAVAKYIYNNDNL